MTTNGNKELSLVSRLRLPGLVTLGFAAALAVSCFGLVDSYIQLVLMYMGINIILTLSLNLVNGFMGEFSVGHAGFMAIGAYTAAFLTVHLLPPGAESFLFPVSVLVGSFAASLSAVLVALPSFRTRGDYLAIITLAFMMIVKSLFENLDAFGGATGFSGIPQLTSLPWVYVWTVFAFWIMRNFVYSSYGRGVLAIREDELAAELSGVHTARCKFTAFLLSAFFAGAAGALFAHLLQFINPRSFDIIKSTEMLVMVYLGGAASLTGSVVGACLFTVLLEVLRPLGVWRMVLLPLLLVLLMLFRQQGIMGGSELKILLPLSERMQMRRKNAGAEV